MWVLTGTLLDQVAEIIPRYNMISPGDRVGVAVSGGADSVVLLHLLRRLSERFGIELFLLHLNHQLRGAESDADEEFVRALAASLGLTVVVERVALATEGNLEQIARLARRHFYLRCMDQYSLCRIALGHTRSDQAETVLLRLVRGCGLAGLAGMRLITKEGFIRPLLTTSREDVRRWATTEGLDWREDSSNLNLDFSRNRLRHQVMPLLAHEFNPNVEAVLAGTAELARAEEDYWSEQIEPIFRAIATMSQFGLILDLNSFSRLQRAVQRRIIRRALSEVKGHLRSTDLRHVDAILRICDSSQGHDRVIVPEIDALRSYDKLRLRASNERPGRDGYRLELKIGGTCRLPFQAGCISVACGEPGASFCGNVEEERGFPAEIANLDAEALGEAGPLSPLHVRNWEPGDAFQRFPNRGPEKLKSLFQEHRILLWERRHWPVVVAGDEIVWTRRFGSAAKFQAAPHNRRVVRLVYVAENA